MEPRIEILPEKKLVGMRIKTCLAENRIHELWRGFMPRRKEIKNIVSAELFSVQLYDEFTNFENFNQNTLFEKWAAVEVSDFNSIPAGMEPYTLTGGLYAVFLHKGDETAAPKTFQYIFGTWLPSSGYFMDKRPQFEMMGDKYKYNDPNSEEDVWVPVREKK